MLVIIASIAILFIMHTCRGRESGKRKKEREKERNVFYVRAFKKRIVAFPKPSVTT